MRPIKGVTRLFYLNSDEMSILVRGLRQGKSAREPVSRAFQTNGQGQQQPQCSTIGSQEPPESFQRMR